MYHCGMTKMINPITFESYTDNSIKIVTDIIAIYLI